MSSRYEFVYVRHPDLEGIGRMSRAQLARSLGFYEVDEDGDPPGTEKKPKKQPTSSRKPTTSDADQPADEKAPTARPAGKSKGR